MNISEVATQTGFTKASLNKAVTDGRLIATRTEGGEIEIAAHDLAAYLHSLAHPFAPQEQEAPQQEQKVPQGAVDPLPDPPLSPAVEQMLWAMGEAVARIHEITNALVSVYSTAQTRQAPPVLPMPPQPLSAPLPGQPAQPALVASPEIAALNALIQRFSTPQSWAQGCYAVNSQNQPTVPNDPDVRAMSLYGALELPMYAAARPAIESLVGPIAQWNDSPYLEQNGRTSVIEMLGAAVRSRMAAHQAPPAPYMPGYGAGYGMDGASAGMATRDPLPLITTHMLAPGGPAATGFTGPLVGA